MAGLPQQLHSPRSWTGSLWSHLDFLTTWWRGSQRDHPEKTSPTYKPLLSPFTFAHVPSAKASQMANPRVYMGGTTQKCEFWETWSIGGHQLVSLPPGGGKAMIPCPILPSSQGGRAQGRFLSRQRLSLELPTLEVGEGSSSLYHGHAQILHKARRDLFSDPGE